MVDAKRSTATERKKERVQRRKVNLLSKLEPHLTVAGADRSWKEMKKKKNCGGQVRSPVSDSSGLALDEGE